MMIGMTVNSIEPNQLVLVDLVGVRRSAAAWRSSAATTFAATGVDVVGVHLGGVLDLVAVREGVALLEGQLHPLVVDELGGVDVAWC